MGYELSRESAIWFDRASATNATGRMDGTIVDMNGFESVCFLASYGTTNAGTESYLSMQMGTATDAMSDATGEIRISQTGLYLDVYRPIKRYVRGQLISTASGKSKVMVTIQYNPRTSPTTHNASTTGLRLYSPGSGTATG